METKVNLLDFDSTAMIAFVNSLGEQDYRAHQLIKWIHQQGHCSFERMTNLSKSFRQKLNKCASIDLPVLVSTQQSSDGTHKWLLKLNCGNCIETVFIPEKGRGTLCVSSQVGCALNCTFCSTAKQGFNRNLSSGEIISQVWFAVRSLSKQNGYHDRQVTNVVMMGMGEPLLNFDNVVSAMNLMMDDFGYGLSKRRITLSTSGVVPQMLRLKEISPVALAVSLHAPNDGLRNQLVPLNKKYPLKMLMSVCRNYFQGEHKRYVTMEYIMLKNINDRPEHAHQLVKLLANIPCKVNLIPFNPFPMTQYERSNLKTINQFREILINHNINTITRKTRGDDIDAACGQLAGQFKDRTKRSERWQRINFDRQVAEA